jgi:PKD repeat protein
VANFSGTPTSGNSPLTVVFTDTSTGSPTSWNWSFGDGGRSDVQNPSYTYTMAGTYTVAMTATNAGGSNTITRVGYITVNNTHTITESWSPNGLGYISISVPTRLNNPGTVFVTGGSSQTFSFVPNSNKLVESYSIDRGVPVYPGRGNGVIVTYTFTNVTANHTLVVTFR